MGRKKNYEPMTIFARLREEYNECHEKRLSQEELGKMLGLSRSTMCRIENGEKAPDFDTLQRYSDFFHISVEELSGTADNKDLKNLTAGALGLSSEAIVTLRLLAEHSDKSQNLMALVNAFLGNEVDTLLFFQRIFSSIKATGPTRMTKLLMSDFIAEYIETIIPKMQRAIENSRGFDYEILCTPDDIKHADTPDN